MTYARKWRLAGGAVLGCAGLLCATAGAALAASATGHVSVTILPAAGATFVADSPAAGSVVVTGAPGTPVALSISSGDLARGPGGALPFRVVAAPRGALSTLDRAGTLRLALGTSLDVGRLHAPGAYHGTYTLTVDY